MPATLLVITGPIGSGKSTVADLVARRLARQGLTAAVADLDDVAFMQRGRVELTEFWRRAGVAHCALVTSWFDQGVDVVVAHGPFFESDSYDDLFATAPEGCAVRHVVLEVTYDEALTRVSADPHRGPDAMSRAPEFLRSTHVAFREVYPALPDSDLRIDTTGRPAVDVADELLDSLF